MSRQQYYQLIDELILCLSGKEAEILEANSELVDDTFRECCADVCTQASQEIADFLTELLESLPQ